MVSSAVIALNIQNKNPCFSGRPKFRIWVSSLLRKDVYIYHTIDQLVSAQPLCPRKSSRKGATAANRWISPTAKDTTTPTEVVASVISGLGTVLISQDNRSKAYEVKVLVRDSRKRLKLADPLQQPIRQFYLTC